MQLVRWNPIRDMFSLSHRVNHMFDDFCSPALKTGEPSMWDWNPVVDYYDNEENIVIKAELPRIDKDNIIVDVKGRFLTLKGERSSENEVEEERYYRRERAYGKFERVFVLPAEVDPDKIRADYQDGVLTIDIPKPVEHKSRQIAVH
jgi:HSP20 family protein